MIWIVQNVAVQNTAKTAKLKNVNAINAKDASIAIRLLTSLMSSRKKPPIFCRKRQLFSLFCFCRHTDRPDEADNGGTQGNLRQTVFIDSNDIYYIFLSIHLHYIVRQQDHPMYLPNRPHFLRDWQLSNHQYLAQRKTSYYE